jgi:hypothetical protein
MTALPLLRDQKNNAVCLMRIEQTRRDRAEGVEMGDRAILGDDMGLAAKAVVREDH